MDFFTILMACDCLRHFENVVIWIRVWRLLIKTMTAKELSAKLINKLCNQGLMKAIVVSNTDRQSKFLLKQAETQAPHIGRAGNKEQTAWV